MRCGEVRRGRCGGDRLDLQLRRISRRALRREQHRRTTLRVTPEHDVLARLRFGDRTRCSRGIQHGIAAGRADEVRIGTFGAHADVVGRDDRVAAIEQRPQCPRSEERGRSRTTGRTRGRHPSSGAPTRGWCVRPGGGGVSGTARTPVVTAGSAARVGGAIHDAPCARRDRSAQQRVDLDHRARVRRPQHQRSARRRRRSRAGRARSRRDAGLRRRPPR